MSKMLPLKNARGWDMRTDVPILDKLLGMYCWVTKESGISGGLKEVPEDFIVEEILPDGTVLSIERPILKPSGYEGLFTHFILVKRNIGNFEALWILAEKLNVPVGFFFYSGNKDREALTVQRMAVWGVPPEKLLEIAKLLRDIQIFSPIRELRRVHIGEHLGNRFTIRIRRIKREEICRFERIYDEILAKEYLPNYFGYQRFGIIRPITHVVGKLLFLRKYEEAMRIYLGAPSVIDDEKMKNIKEEILSGNYEYGLKELPNRGFLFEKMLLKELMRGKTPKEAFKKLPAFLLRMLGEAYQAYLFNKILSKIILHSDFLINKGTRLVLIPGYQTRLGSDWISDIIREVLTEEGISINHFKNKEFPPLSFKGTLRPAFLKPRFEYVFIPTFSEAGELSIVMRFKLNKGEYATIILREFFKHNIYEALLSKSVLKRKATISDNFNKLVRIIQEGLTVSE